jgi:small subunit ribosomal protein S18
VEISREANRERRRIMADESNKTTAPGAGAATTDAPSARPDGGAPREGGGGGGYGAPRGPRPAGRPGGGSGGPGGGGGRKFFRRKKVCKFCVEKIDGINYKDVRLLSGFVSEAGKIVPRRLTGVCTPHQRRLADAIKQARNIALLPFGGR